ncbi:unnamed protein product [Trifolium pratense]|uniref:Uncharacterized protein n=1 Tax=Trifolium pratense TaxID=57577 RepID=A0ACB0IYZ3_TRIPR|nr:unnamed protein product [Trifolium pratense]
MESTGSKFYDVFVSFRGTDTRFGFTGHFFHALQKNGISTWMGGELELDGGGESIVSAVHRAIENSQMFVVVFSEQYASSAWCLEELVKILECVQLYGKPVVPIFYHVHPFEVRSDEGSYAKTFSELENRFHDSEKLQRWRDAITQIGNLSGWDLTDKSEFVEMQKIVKSIINMLGLGHKFPSVPNDLVGMYPIKELETLLLLDSDDVRAVGIWGMSGVGKTTIAAVLYRKIFHQFDACCFIEDVSKLYRLHDGPIGVQNQILQQTLSEKQNQIYNFYDDTNLIQNRLCGLSALIVLDNVDHIEQLEKLAVNHKSLAAGSRIIVISTDKHILKEYGVDALHKVEVLNETDSLQLFWRKALDSDSIMSDTLEECIHEILCIAGGLPLVITVLGSFLFGQSIPEWSSALARLRESPNEDPNEDIMNMLQLSFNGLEENEREIFLHISCFFKGHEKDYVENVLNCCGFHADSGLIVLIKKSLISFSNGKIEMHALMEELGRKVVHGNSSMDSRKWSKLWLHEQFYNVVLENMETNVDAVVLYGSQREKGKLMAETLSKMNRLRLLILKEVEFSGSLDYISNELRYVEWDEYPFLYLPSSFQPNQLVELILVDSSIKQLWIGTKKLPTLRILDLSYSENLTKMPDFREFPNLKRLNLEGCVKLVQIDSSIGLLRELVFLNLKNCESLMCIPNEISGLTSLNYLNLCGCSKAFNNPKAREDFSSCMLPSLPSFSCLGELDISFCNLSQIPDALGSITWLGRLNLRGNKFITLPSLKKLSKLEYLTLEHCKQLTSLPELPSPHAIEQNKHKRTAMYIFNCPELGEREHCTSMTLSWMRNFIKANYDTSSSSQQIDIVIPGSEIPCWFNNRRMGRSISIDPSPIAYDINIIGIACCVVFHVEPSDPTKTTSEWGPVIRLGFKSSNAANNNYVVIPVTLYRHLITVKSNHMWLIYFDRELFFSLLSSTGYTVRHLDDIKMEASITNGQGLHLEVKSCGFRWVFQKQL